MGPPIRTRLSFPLSQFHPTGSFHRPLTLLHQRADRMKTAITENLSNGSHGPQPCLTQCNYEPCHVGPPKTGHGGDFWQSEVNWRRKWWTTSVFLPENPMNNMKGQKDMTLKDELPRSVGAQYVTGEEWRNNSRKNEERSQSKNNTQLWMQLVME